MNIKGQICSIDVFIISPNYFTYVLNFFVQHFEKFLLACRNFPKIKQILMSLKVPKN